MRTLPDVTPSPEQLAIISRNSPGTEVIRGAAGSGKTTTALLKLTTLIGVHLSRKQRLQRDEPIRVLVLTFNRTLKGYIEALAQDQPTDGDEIDLEISTFGRWVLGLLGWPDLVLDHQREALIKSFGRGISLPPDFLVEEVDYALGRFLPSTLHTYLTARREGRGTAPRVERPVREAILRDVVEPYSAYKRERGLLDWNDVAVQLTTTQCDHAYDVIIIDEAQDFSANQIRAVRSQLADVHSLVFVVDTAQRIYARGFSWQETGLTIRPEHVHRLTRNYRNTAEIARFAASLIDGLPLDADATMPDFDSCDRHGEQPLVLRGRFSSQVGEAIRTIRNRVDLGNESVAFLHPLGGRWFDFLRDELTRNGLPFVEITRQSEWPDGDENIALSTLASAKGLEFDHVFILGLNAEVLNHGDDEEDEQLTRLRRLLAMGIGRAKHSVAIGYKPEDAPRLINYLDTNTYREVDL